MSLFMSLIEITHSIMLSYSKFPLGVQQFNLLTKMRLKAFIIPPGNFYDGARKQNLLVVNPGYNYIFTLRCLSF